MTEPCTFCGDRDGCCPCNDICDGCGEVEARCVCLAICDECLLLIGRTIGDQPCRGLKCQQLRWDATCGRWREVEPS